MIDILKNTCLFKKISEDEIKEIISIDICDIKSYKKGAIIANQGDKCNTLSIVLEGLAVIQNIYENGKVLTLAKFNPGDIFAEALLFSKDKEYPATVMAQEDCKLVFFPREVILKAMQKNLKFSENVLGLLSQKIVMLNKKINLIELDSIRKKICKILLDNYKKTNSLLMKISSKKDMAENLGIPRPSLSRELINMKSMNLIDFNLKQIKILDLESLEDELFL